MTILNVKKRNPPIAEINDCRTTDARRFRRRKKKKKKSPENPLSDYYNARPATATYRVARPEQLLRVEFPVRDLKGRQRHTLLSATNVHKSFARRARERITVLPTNVEIRVRTNTRAHRMTIIITTTIRYRRRSPSALDDRISIRVYRFSILFLFVSPPTSPSISFLLIRPSILPRTFRQTRVLSREQ